MSEAIRERRRIGRNLIGSYGHRGVLALSVLLLTPYLFRKLGVDGFGTWSVIFTLAAIVSLLELGPSAGTTKFIAQQRAEGREEQVRITVGVSVVMMTLVGFMAAGAMVAIALIFPGLAAEGQEEQFKIGMLSMALATLIRFPFSAYGAALTGLQRWDLFRITEMITLIAFALGAVAALELGGGIVGLSVAQGFAFVLGGVAMAVYLRRVAPELPLGPHLSARPELRELSGFGSLALLADAMVFVGVRMDTVLIAGIRSAAAAAPFAVALKLQSGLQSLTLPFLYLLMPMTSELWAQGRGDEVERRMALSTRVALQLTLPVAAALSFFAEDLIAIWLGSTAPSVTATIVILLMASQTVTLTALAAEKVLVGIGEVRKVGGLALIEGVGNLGLSIYLITQLGAVGAALGTLVTAVVAAPVRFPLACGALGISTRRFLVAAIWPGLLSSLPGLALMALAWLTMEEGLARALVGGVVGLGCSALVAAQQIGIGSLRETLKEALGRDSGPRVDEPVGA